MDAKQRIARRVAQELRDGDIVNLGIGLPTMVANYLPEGIHITLQSENGFLGLGPVTTAHPDLVNAGGQPCGILPGAAMFDSAMSFALIRGGHIDACVLGGLQVDEEANLANKHQYTSSSSPSSRQAKTSKTVDHTESTNLQFFGTR